MVNKFKWNLKKVLIFLNYPLKTITYKFDFEYINTLLSNENIIKTNEEKYTSLDDSLVSSYDFQKESESSRRNSIHLQDGINPEYFTNLNHYGYGHKILEDANYNNFDFLESFHLYPANVFVINEIIKLIKNGQIKEGLIVDFPSGIGNLFIYLDRFYNKSKFVGIDNFKQISREEVLKYQKGIGNKAEIKTYEEFKHELIHDKVDLLVSIELNLDLIIEEIMEIDPEFLMFETMYVSRYKDLLEIIVSKYDVYCINESIVTYKKRGNL
tara:strand:+ start:562 stop:1368 length:807 start_codon:yes stop_codon:yes gene_type:complete